MFARLAAAVLLSLLLPASSPALTAVRVTRNVPTRKGFALGYIKTALPTWTRSGMLTCLGAFECLVTGMPLLWQMDPKLAAPLKAYLKRYTNAAGQVTWAEPQFGIPATPMSPDDYVQRILDNGCYISSITLAMNASLASARAGLNPTGRAATFDALTADATLSKPERQLLWQYERWADKLQPNQSDPTQPSPTDFLELQEFAQDFHSASVTTGSLGAQHLESAALAAQLRKGTLLVIAYGEYQLNAGAPDANGVRTISFARLGQHKVTVAGFTQFAYPLVIADVGDGLHHNVKVTADWSQLTYQLGGAAVPYTKLRFDPSMVGTSAVIYEGAPALTLNAPDQQLFLLDDVTTLSVPAPP